MMAEKVPKSEETDSVTEQDCLRKISFEEEREDGKKHRQLNVNRKDTDRTKVREEKRKSDEDENTNIPTRKESSDKTEEGLEQVN